jgi:hypothetical protein
MNKTNCQTVTKKVNNDGNLKMEGVSDTVGPHGCLSLQNRQWTACVTCWLASNAPYALLSSS